MSLSLLSPNIPNYVLGAGISSEFGTWTPPGSRVAAYVCSAGAGDNSTLPANTPVYATLNQGLSQCRAGMGDVVFVLPNHAESITGADFFSSMVAGTRIIGLGHGTIRPTFTWTATASSWLLNDANTVIQNCIFVMAATTATTVTAPMTISAAGCALIGCRILTSASATVLSATAITVTAADCGIIGCTMTAGTSDGTGVTCSVLLTGADRFRMYDTVVRGATSSTTVGVLKFVTTASLDVDVRNCEFYNAKAAGTAAILGMAGASGSFKDCKIGYLDNTTTTWALTAGNLQSFNSLVVNTVGENAMVGTVVSA